MAYAYSHPVDPSALASRGCFTILPVRKSNHEGMAITSSFEIFEEYNRLVGKKDITKGVYDPRGHAVSFCYPECIPEQIDVLTRMQEFGHFQDDAIDAIDTPVEARATNYTVVDSYGLKADLSLPGNVITGNRGMRQIEAKMFLQALAFDREVALDTMNKWKQWLELESGTCMANEFGSFDEWVPYRYENAALKLTHEIGCFAAGIKISEEEKLAVEHIVRPAMTALGLVNDYYSYDKEYAEYMKKGGKNGVTNSIWVLMIEHGIDKAAAKGLLAQKITAFEEEYLAARESYENDHPNLSQPVRSWIDTAALLAAGCHYWSTFACRNNRPEYLEPSPVWSNGPGDGSIHCSPNPNKNTSPENETPHMPDRVFEIPLEQQRQDNILSQVIKCGDQTLASNDEENCPFTDTIVREISAEAVLEPHEYLRSLGSKGVRQAAIEALTFGWTSQKRRYQQSAILSITFTAVRLCRLDDIQDQSALRRGSPATHVLFGEAQTINSANFLFVLSLEELYKLHHPQSTVIYNAQLRRLHIGQSMDLYWTRHVTCPTVAEYIDMVDHKTGGLFNLAGGLMQAEGCCNGQLNLDCLMTLLGRYFQKRDDYSNIVSADYAAAKGFCEDLDEGKFSLLLVHALRISQKQKHRLQAIMQERKHNGSGMSVEMKGLVLEMLRIAGSLEYVKGVIRKLEDAIDTEIRRIEGVVGEENYVMRLLLERLRVD